MDLSEKESFYAADVKAVPFKNKVRNSSISNKYMKLPSNVTYKVVLKIHSASDLPITDSAALSSSYLTVSIDNKEYGETKKVSQKDSKAKWEEVVVVTDDLKDINSTLSLKIFDYYDNLYESRLLGMVLVNLKDIPFAKDYTRIFSVDSSPFHHLKSELKVTIIVTANQKLHILEKLDMLENIQSNLIIDSKLFQPKKKDQLELIYKNVSAKLVSSVIKKHLKLYFSDNTWEKIENEHNGLEARDGQSILMSNNYDLKVTVHSILDISSDIASEDSQIFILLMLGENRIGQTLPTTVKQINSNVPLEQVFTLKDLSNLNQEVNLQLYHSSFNNILGTTSLNLSDLSIGKQKTIVSSISNSSDSQIIAKVAISLIISKQENNNYHHGKENGFNSLRPSSHNGNNSEFVNSLRKNISISQFELELKNQSINQIKHSCKVFESYGFGYKSGCYLQINSKNKFEELDLSPFVVTNQPSSASGSRLEDTSSQLIKKEGMSILIDPSYSTGEHKVKLIISYKKQIDLSNYEDVTKDVYLWSAKNYSFGLKLTEEYNSGYNAPRNCSLPGWQGRSPIFLPVNKCIIRIVVEPSINNETPIDAKTLYQLSNFKIFATICNNTKHGIKLLFDYSNEFFKTQAANSTIPGGFSALNFAALHGNLEAVDSLVSKGANVNLRSASSKFHTALHDAVLGGHKDVVNYLLKNNANQLLKDENGLIPLHRACILGDIAIARILMNDTNGKRALLMTNNTDQKAYELCSNTFMKIQIEAAMRKLNIFAKPRVSIMDRK